MVSIDVSYDGDLRCTALHGPSRATLLTDAPLDNQGKGAAFSPTDLVATGLATCMATTMGIVAQRESLSLEGLRVGVTKHMTATPLRRIARLDVRISLPNETARALSSESRSLLEQTAHGCPVRLSLLDAIEVPIVFEWG